MSAYQPLGLVNMSYCIFRLIYLKKLALHNNEVEIQLETYFDMVDLLLNDDILFQY